MKNKWSAILILIILVSFFSCKKDKLEDGKEIFIGKWNWEYSEHTYNVCSGDPPITNIITPETELVNYSMIFIEKGIVEFYRNDTFLEKNRLRFNAFGDESNFGVDWKRFSFYVNNKGYKALDANYGMYGHISPNELLFIRGFPFSPLEYPLIEKGCDDYRSHFVKE